MNSLSLKVGGLSRIGAWPRGLHKRELGHVLGLLMVLGIPQEGILWEGWGDGFQVSVSSNSSDHD